MFLSHPYPSPSPTPEISEYSPEARRTFRELEVPLGQMFLSDDQRSLTAKRVGSFELRKEVVARDGSTRLSRFFKRTNLWT